MEIIFAALRLLTRALEATKVYLELRRLNEDDDHPDARRTTRRPKHLKG